MIWGCNYFHIRYQTVQRLLILCEPVWTTGGIQVLWEVTMDSKCLIWAFSVCTYSLKVCLSSVDPSSPWGDCSFPWKQLSLFGEDGPTGTIWQKENEKITVRSFACSPSKDSKTLSAPMKKIPKDQNRKSLSCQKINLEGKTQSANSQTAKTDIIF